ncbi:TetR/AcrR family transcriptional regulator [Nonomuraea gerenzanensis]|uniref:TetR family regulatory protein of MDR cluster n=1 Tax=Nonomuraea gerenzanensis TaxID=93944 RepID=A0A1M4EFY4_9ACTN|nr:TetR/AcrR family transcriptional regulator [Nonomuraea gerenzanensis]UBU09387.1 TetR/AcrR family transcriptional regulator [Nonomuraea gerenzanensis]SBO97799.1 TetR family regulatory protein of MDR cluster [Nonomuraea gerenzanensis]
MTTSTRDRGEEQADPRVRRTTAALRATLIELVQHRDLSRISVADVAERAGVSRSTFYDHYRDVHELAAAACTAMIDELIEAIPRHHPAPPESPPDTLLTFFAHLAEHASLYRSVLGPQGSARVMDHVRHRATVAVYAHRTGAGLPDLATDIPHDVPAAFTAGALLSVATDWLQRGCPCPPAEMAALTLPLLLTLYREDTGRRA